MLENIFSYGAVPSVKEIAIAFGTAVLCGLIISAAYRLGAKKASKSMLVTVIILPAVVQTLIMIVNGSIGTGIAIMGAFSLVRFRSAPGSSRDICSLFIAMTAGIASGAGYAAYALIFTAAVCVIMTAAERIIPDNVGAQFRRLKIFIPENMDYEGVFDDILKEYTSEHELNFVRTVNMGTMYELMYTVRLKKGAKEKEMLDKIRCRNGNLTVSCGAVPDKNEEI